MLISDQIANKNLSQYSEYECRHVAIIMDGNGRWAKKQGKIRSFGHEAGANSVRRAVSFAAKNSITALTLYAFSIENWKRPKKEISMLMQLFIRTLYEETKRLHQDNIRLKIIGNISCFNEKLKNRIVEAEKLTSDNTGLTLNIAVNYSGRWDIIQGVYSIAKKIHAGLLKPEQINEKILSKHICMNELVPVDLVIRTGGEYRISNFLLWQIAYSELYFTDVLWPDFNEQDFQDALYSYSNRKRRFGRVEYSKK